MFKLTPTEFRKKGIFVRTTQTTYEELRRLALTNKISFNEQMNRLIEKGIELENERKKYE